MSLNERKKRILKHIVDNYIEIAEPVSSKTLSLHEDFNLSSATLRNEMAVLEKKGYLIHPHTSAGRVPTDKGYREYVDNLMDIPDKDNRKSPDIEEYFSNNDEEISTLLKNASRALAHNTGYTSIVISPCLKKSSVKQLKLIQVDSEKILLIVVLEDGIVKNRLIRMTEMPSDKDIRISSQIMETGLSGKPVGKISLGTVLKVAKESKMNEKHLKPVVKEIYETIKQYDSVGVYFDGIYNLLDYPEFSKVDRVKVFWDNLSDKEKLVNYFDEVSQADYEENPFDERNVIVKIGEEISLEGFQDCSFVTTVYSSEERISGNLVVVGPKRMDYCKAVLGLGYIREKVNEHLKRICLKGCENQGI